MVTSTSSFGHATTVVGRPRAGDAIGAALRDAYLREVSVPDDMMVLIARLNGNGGMRISY